MTEYPRGICDLDSNPHPEYTKCRNWRQLDPDALGTCDEFQYAHAKALLCTNWKPIEKEKTADQKLIDDLKEQLRRAKRRAEQAEETAEKFSSALYRIRSAMDDVFPS